MKSLSAGENREVVYGSWAKIREAGAVVEEAASDDEKGDQEGYGVNEKERWGDDGSAEPIDEKMTSMRLDAGEKELRNFDIKDQANGRLDEVDMR